MDLEAIHACGPSAWQKISRDAEVQMKKNACAHTSLDALKPHIHIPWYERLSTHTWGIYESNRRSYRGVWKNACAHAVPSGSHTPSTGTHTSHWAEYLVNMCTSLLSTINN